MIHRITVRTTPTAATMSSRTTMSQSKAYTPIKVTSCSFRHTSRHVQVLQPWSGLDPTLAQRVLVARLMPTLKQVVGLAV